MKKKKHKLLILFALVAASVARAQESRTEYNFLRLPISAHAAAMGGSGVAIIEDDASLIFHNPALLSTVSDKSVGLNYMNYMSGSNMLSASFTRVATERASWGATAQYINYGSMSERTDEGVETGNFNAKDIALAGYFSYLLTDHLAGGVAAKVVTSYIADYNAIALGVDLGLNYYDPDHGWSASLVAKNLGGELKAYDEDYGRMPIDVQLGVSKQLKGAPLRFSLSMVDLNHWNYKFVNHLQLGADLSLGQSVWIGAGYNFRRANEMGVTDDEGTSSSHGAALSFGAGMNLQHFHLNVSYGKYHVSTSSVNVNLAYAF